MRVIQIDVGNTRLKWRLLAGASILSSGLMVWREYGGSVDNSFPDDWTGADEAQVACVGGEAARAWVASMLNMAGVSPVYWAESRAMTCGVRSAYAAPERLGVDRWLAMISARARSRGAFCVMDLGSAWTIDYVDSDGGHLGGYILPGIRLYLSSLSVGTALLPEVAAADVRRGPGRSTEECIRFGGGVYLQSVMATILGEMQGLLGRCAELYVTGGDAHRIMDFTGGIPVQHVPDLVMDGLGLQIASDLGRL